MSKKQTGTTEVEFDDDPLFNDKIKQWKHDHHGKITQFGFTTEEGKKVYAYARKPDREEYMYYFATRAQDQAKANEVLYNTCMLGEHPEIRDEQYDFYTSLLVFHVYDLIDLQTAHVKKK
jgi:hypothetical protein